MAKLNTADIGFEDQIWKAADKMRGNLDASVNGKIGVRDKCRILKLRKSIYRNFIYLCHIAKII